MIVQDMDKKENTLTAKSLKMIAEIKYSEDGHFLGELDCVHFNEPFAFSCLVRMIEMMEITFDVKGYPEMQLLPRSFGRAKKRIKKFELDLHKHINENKTDIIQSKTDGRKCTFELVVNFRNHAEWQGQIYWVDKDVTRQFLSIIEMMKLIDEALVLSEAAA